MSDKPQKRQFSEEHRAKLAAAARLREAKKRREKGIPDPEIKRPPATTPPPPTTAIQHGTPKAPDGERFGIMDAALTYGVNALPVQMPKSVTTNISRRLAQDKYQPQIVRGILQNIAIGLPETRAANLEGVSSHTWIEWKNKHPDLVQCVEHAGAVCQQELQRLAVQGIAKQPRIAIDLLERRFPAEWAAANKVAHTGHVTVGSINPGDLASIQQARATAQDAEVIEAEEVKPESD